MPTRATPRRGRFRPASRRTEQMSQTPTRTTAMMKSIWTRCRCSYQPCLAGQDPSEFGERRLQIELLVDPQQQEPQRQRVPERAHANCLRQRGEPPPLSEERQRDGAPRPHLACGARRRAPAAVNGEAEIRGPQIGDDGDPSHDVRIADPGRPGSHPARTQIARHAEPDCHRGLSSTPPVASERGGESGPGSGTVELWGRLPQTARP